MIRPAKLKDIPELLRMGECFFNCSGYKDLTTFDKKDTEKVLRNLIKEGWVFTDGKHCVIGFLVFPIFMNNKTLVAQELFWWVDECARKTGVGVEALKRAEAEAKKSGATTMMMLSIEDLDGEKVNKLYEKLGYKRREQTYMRRL